MHGKFWFRFSVLRAFKNTGFKQSTEFLIINEGNTI